MKQKIKTGIPFRDFHFVMNNIQLCNSTLDLTVHQKPLLHTLLLITGGQGNLKIENESIKLHRGACIYIRPEIPMVFAQKSDEPLVYFKLSFSINYIDGSDAKEENDNVTTVRPLNQNEWLHDGLMENLPTHMLEKKMQELLQYWDEEDEWLQIQNHFRFQNLIYFIVEHMGNRVGEKNAKLAVERTIQYLQQHYREVSNIEQLAQMANMSRRWYNTLFKEMTGQSPTEYLTELRINRAKELMHIAGNRLYDIAREVGFQDEHYFSRRFKQSVGASPRHYIMNRRHLGISVTYPELLYSIGVTPIAAPVGNDDFPEYLKEPFSNISRLPCTRELDYDTIRSVKPDLILAPMWKDQQNYETLSSIATTVLLPERDNWREELCDIAEVLGKKKEAKHVIQNYEYQIEIARVRLREILQNESVAYLRVTKNEAVIYGRQSSRGKMLHEELGLQTMPALHNEQLGYTLAKESSFKFDADHIILHLDQPSHNAQKMYVQWARGNQANNEKLFKGKSIYPVGGMHWYNFSFSPLATCLAIQELISCLESKKNINHV
ncbi:AraC family transcriptional regulator [Paenibacillus turicensis]|uniref:helix-turn-helix domain-containing protein n=1 Tax=Paenibacillus turicensis TaxID=160487 RepID=UPI003D2C75FE